MPTYTFKVRRICEVEETLLMNITAEDEQEAMNEIYAFSNFYPGMHGQDHTVSNVRTIERKYGDVNVEDWSIEKDVA